MTESLSVSPDGVFPDGLQQLCGILGRPLKSVCSIDMGHTEAGCKALVPFEIAAGAFHLGQTA